MVNFYDGENKNPKQEVEQISGGVDIYPKYTDTKRFDLKTIQEGDWTNYRLKISSRF